jgi:hypothetical protein
MLRSLEIKNFRGIEQMRVDDLGRVNLVIGENDSGKTSLLAAAVLAWSPAHLPLALDCGFGLRPSTEAELFEAVRLLCRGADAERGFELVGVSHDGVEARSSLRSGASLTSKRFALNVALSGAMEASFDGHWAWEGAFGPQPVSPHPVTPKLRPWFERGTSWSPSGTRVDPSDIEVFRKIFRDGKDAAVLDAMRLVAPHVNELSLDPADVLVRLDDYRVRMPISVLGDGARAAFVLAVGLAAENASMLIADEIENGLHFSALSKIWGLLRTHGRDRQVFCTTHQESCIRAAVDAFADAPNELRVIRTQRVIGRHLAVVYDWESARDALELGWEMRG